MTDPIHQLAAILRDTAATLTELEPALRAWYTARAWPPRRGEPITGANGHNTSDPTGQTAGWLADEYTRDLEDANELRRIAKAITARRQQRTATQPPLRTCLAAGCPDLAQAGRRGYCGKHYMQAYRDDRKGRETTAM